MKDTFSKSCQTAQPKTLASAQQGQQDIKVTRATLPKVLTPPQAAELLQVSTKTLLKMAADEKIPAFRAGRLWRFPTAALEAWLSSFQIQTP